MVNGLMRKFDHIVAGGGVSGMTAALLLALNGRKVLLLEKAPNHLGGSLARFHRGGIPFDTGFHFTGGLQPGGLFHRMLSALGLLDHVETEFMTADHAHRFVFESEGRTVDLPCGIPSLKHKLKAEFPGDRQAVDAYFDRVEKVRAGTASMDMTRLGESTAPMDEESVSLKSVLDDLTDNALLKAVWCGLGMCYGVKPSEVSFANHSRICYDLYQSTARFKGGGDALVDAFKAAFSRLGVEVACGCWIAECRLGENNLAERFILSTGEEIVAESAVLTLHPFHILKLLPRSCVSKAFVHRVEAFEPSLGFFTVYGVWDGAVSPGFGSSVVSLFPTTDFEALLDPSYRGDQALVSCESVEKVGGAVCRVITAFEPSFREHVAPWEHSKRGHRPSDYSDYKAKRIESIRKRLGQYNPAYRQSFRILDAASMLTYRDYLNSPDGSAYGIKQKVGQYNLIGKLPVRNLFAAGQSSLLPGIAGAMMSSFIVSRAVLGKDNFNRFMSGKLCT